MKIDDVEYVRKDSMPTTSEDIQIVVLDRGFVYIGNVKENPTTGMYVISNAHNIRVWGTTKGLGELVNGPTSKTVLDKVGTVRVFAKAITSVIDVDCKKWNLS